MDLSAVLIAAGIAAAVALTMRRGRIDGASARRLVHEQGARLLDVRTQAEHEADGIDGAVNVPLHELPARLAELQPPDRPVVVYCQSGARSGRAARLLKRSGFTAVHDLGARSRWPA